MEEDKKQLMEQIGEAINEVVKVKEIQNIKSLSRHNPQKVAKVLYLYATGVSQTKIVRKYKVSRDTVLNILVDYADHIGKLKDLAGRISAKNYMNISSLEEDLVDKVRDRMETDPEMEVTFRDLKELSIAKSNAFREAMSSRGEAHSITEDRKIITQDDYNETVREAQERIKKIKGEVIELDD
jgi:hypothetical protein